MFRTVLLAAILMMMAATANAEAPKENGVYLGLSAGASIFDDDGAIGYYDDTDNALQGYIGYKFLPYFGIEARAADLGRYSDGFDSLDLSSVSIHAVGIIPFGSSGWELFGQIGLAQISQKVVGFYSEDDSAGTAGGGVRWHVNPSLAIAAQIDAYVWQNDLIGSNYDLSVGTEMLSIQFNF